MKKQLIWDPYKDFQHSTLPNGLHIYSAYWDRPWMHIRFCLHSGALEDPKGKEGLAHFVEHMLSKRSGQLSSKNIIKSILRIGGSVDFGHTGPYSTYLIIEIPIGKNNVAETFELLGSILVYPLEEKWFFRERSVILQEFKKHYPILLRYELAMLSYANAYYGTRLYQYKDAIGCPESIGSITMDDIEEFFFRRYVPANMSIIGVGGLRGPDFEQIVSNSLLSLSMPGNRTKTPKILTKLPYPKNNELVLEFSKLFHGMQFDVSTIDCYALIPATISRKAVVILQRILKNILFQELREKSGSIYVPEISWEFLGDAHVLHFGLVLQKEKLDEIKNSIIISSMEKARSKTLFSQEKRYLIRSYLVNDLNIEEFAEEAQKMLVKFGHISSNVQEIEMIERLSVDEYCSLIDYLSDSKRWWTMINVP